MRGFFYLIKLVNCNHLRGDESQSFGISRLEW